MLTFPFLALPALFHLPKLFFSIVLLLFLPPTFFSIFIMDLSVFGGRMFIVGTASSSKWKTATQAVEDGRRETS